MCAAISVQFLLRVVSARIQLSILYFVCSVFVTLMNSVALKNRNKKLQDKIYREKQKFKKLEEKRDYLQTKQDNTRLKNESEDKDSTI